MYHDLNDVNAHSKIRIGLSYSFGTTLIVKINSSIIMTDMDIAVSIPTPTPKLIRIQNIYHFLMVCYS